ncbi:MAG TPA: hypothetical protein DF383_06595 [Deltaproteobacteria bacterium]|nr:hypothetical protein [Deltaproteobacteria bacterium]
MIEDLKSEFRFVVEHVSTLNQSLRGEINQMKVENNERFDRIETVLKSHSRMLQENEKRWKDNEKRWEDNEKRLERIETKLDDVVEKVERHDQEISVLKSRPLVS